MIAGLDFGTQGAKGVLVSDEGKIVARAARGYPTRVDSPGMAEQDPEDWWSACVSILRELGGAGRCMASPCAPRSGTGATGVDAVGLSGHMHGPVLLDSRNRPVRPCMLWMDARATREVEVLKAASDLTSRIAGSPVTEAYTAPKLMWLRTNEPAVFSSVARFAYCKDYVRLRLTGELATDPTDASGSLLFDLRRREWSPALLEAAGLPERILPEVVESCGVAGRVTADAAAETGIPEGTPVAAGAGDLAASLVGAGLTTPGSVLLGISTAGQVMGAIDRLDPSSLGKVFHFAHVWPGLWFMLGSLVSGGLCLAWLLDAVREVGSGRPGYDTLESRASDVPCGSDGLVFLPYIAGGTGTPHNDPSARGAFVGLTTKHTFWHMARAVMEGVAFGMRQCAESLWQATPGHEAGPVLAAGGGSRSDLWLSIMADVLARPVWRAYTHDASALGAALVAAVATGRAGSASDVRAAVPPPTERFDPDPQRVATCERCYAVFKRLYGQLSPAFRDLSSLQC